MMTTSVRQTVRPTLLILTAVMILPVIGCSSSPRSDLTVTNLKTRQAFSQSFPVAYANHNGAGDVDVVLTQDSRATTGEARTTAPANAGTLRQVMHVRVLWQPMKGTKTDSPTATNATISWYVISDNGRTTRMIEYSGAAFVDLTRKGNLTEFEVRHASLKVTGRVGDLADPIGPARVEGTILAQNSRQQVADVLSDVRSSVSAANATARVEAAKGASSQLPAE